MAAAMVCRLCLGFITDKKSYRKIDSLKSLETQLNYLNLTSPGILCCFCFNKINKLNKIDLDLRTRVEKLNAEKSQLIGELKSLPGFSVKADTPKRHSGKRERSVDTPQSQHKPKRPLTKTPLKHGKSRKELVYSTSSTCSPVKSEVSTALTCTLSHQEKSTQTRVADNDFEVKVNNILVFF